MLKLKAEKRDLFGKKVAALRKAGKLPVVVYGAGEEPLHLSVSEVDFAKAWKDAGETSVINIDAGDVTKDVLIQDVAFDPVKDKPIHVDFLVVRQDQVLSVNVPLVFSGVAPAAKGGVLVKVLHEVEVEALPKDLPREIVVDLSVLETMDQKILVKDLKLPAGVKVNAEPDGIVVLVTAVVEEKEEVAVPVDLSAIEVEKKGKKEEEGAEGAASEPAAKPAK
ncbi:MAG: 50S ribosomal protein L25 [Candidatus Paceibacterota bacterium]|jgi:large subunit ribosomal protein L25